MSNKCITNIREFTPKENEVISLITHIVSDTGRDISKIKFKPTQTYISASFYDISHLRSKIGSQVKFISIPIHLEYIIKLFKLENSVEVKDDWIRIPIANTESILELSALILEVFDFCYAKSVGDTFGCCSKYVECSDAKACIQEHEQWAKGCYYRKNLINGKIYYGKNVNIKAGL